MSNKFVAFQTVIDADWLNSVDQLVWGLFGGHSDVGYVQSALGYTDVPTDNKMYGRRNQAWEEITDSGGGSTSDHPPGMQRPEWYGTGNTEVEIQQAITMMQDGDALVLSPGTTYTLSTTINFNKVKSRITCLEGHTEGLPVIKANTPGMTLVNIQSTGVRVSGIAFKSSDSEATNPNDTYASTKALVFDQSLVSDIEEGANVDGEVVNCGFINCHTSVFIKGRNLTVSDNLFTQCRYGVVGEVYHYGAGDTNTAQFRGIHIHHNRFHFVGRPKAVGTDKLTETYCIKMPLVSGEATPGGPVCQDIKIENNYADGCADFYYGTLHNTTITDNHITFACGAFVTCTPSSGRINTNGSSLIANNDWQSAIDSTYWYIPPNWMVVDSVNNLFITGNVAIGTSQELLKCTSVYNAMITNNFFNLAGGNTAPGTVTSAILLGGQSNYDETNLCLFSNNTVRGNKHRHAIKFSTREEYWTLGLNNLQQGTDVTIKGSSGNDAYAPTRLFIQEGWGSGEHGDIMLEPSTYYEKPNGAHTQIKSNVTISGWAIINGQSITVAGTYTPASQTDPGTVGEICFDSNYMYRCVGPNQWKRVPLGWDAADLLRVTGTLTAQDLSNLHLTPITVIPAPGAGKAIVVTSAQLFMDYNNSAWQVNANSDFVLKYTNSSGNVILTIETTGFLDQLSDQMRYSIPLNSGVFNPTPNNPVVIHNTGMQLLVGNSPVKYLIEYKVIDVSL